MASATVTKYATFGFGSNSVRQLCGRIGDNSLRGYPGRIHDYTLAFAGPNTSWSYDLPDGGTATLVPLSGETAFGTVVFLTEMQLKILDGFEGTPHIYDRRTINAEVQQNSEWTNMEVIAYIKVDSSIWYPPTEAYRCAVLRNIRGSFPTLKKLVLRDTDGTVHEEWVHPGFSELTTQNALLFEVGVRKETPWALPREIGKVMKKVKEAGISATVNDVISAVERNALPLKDDELTILRRLLAKPKTARSSPACYDFRCPLLI